MEQTGRSSFYFGSIGGLFHFQTKPAMSALVQVFGRQNSETINAHGRPASEKRQGTKSGVKIHFRPCQVIGCLDKDWA